MWLHEMRNAAPFPREGALGRRTFETVTLDDRYLMPSAGESKGRSEPRYARAQDDRV
jgi:hypothetical protein